MDHTDREYVSTAINFFWDDGKASFESVNERSAQVVYTAYSDHGNKAFLFVIGKDTKLLKIDSDFLDGESLKRIAEDI